MQFPITVATSCATVIMVLANVPSVASDTSPPALPVKKEINAAMLAKYDHIPVTVVWEGKKTKYAAVPLRTLFKEMLPSIPIDSMPDWKALSREELLLEVKGSDGYPGLVTATEMAINTAGDKFILASKRNDKTGKDEVGLYCKADEERVRWVRDVASLRILQVPKE